MNAREHNRSARRRAAEYLARAGSSLPQFSIKQTRSAKSLGKRIIKYRMAYVFILPALVHYAVFGLYPMISGLRLAFFKWDGLSPDMEFVGLDNLIEAFQDARFWNAFGHNVGIALVSVSGRILVGLALALLVEKVWAKLQDLTKTIVFIPQMISMVVVALVFKMFFEPNFGKVNTLLTQVGLEGWARSWLTEVKPFLHVWNLTLLVIAAVMIWKGYGMSMVIYSAAFKALPSEIYDAARIDGAHGWALFRHVTWPLLWPVTSMLIVLGVIGSMQVFDIVYVMTGGGPFHRTETIAVYIIERTFVSSAVTGALPNYGYSMALAVLLFLLIATVTLVNLRFLRRQRFS